MHSLHKIANLDLHYPGPYNIKKNQNYDYIVPCDFNVDFYYAIQSGYVEGIILFSIYMISNFIDIRDDMGQNRS